MKLKYFNLIESKLLSKNIPSWEVHNLLREIINAKEGNTLKFSYELKKKIRDLDAYADIYLSLQDAGFKVKYQNSEGKWLN